MQFSSLLIGVFLVMWDKVAFYVHDIKLNWKSNIYYVLKFVQFSFRYSFCSDKASSRQTALFDTHFHQPFWHNKKKVVDICIYLFTLFVIII